MARAASSSTSSGVPALRRMISVTVSCGSAASRERISRYWRSSSTHSVVSSPAASSAASSSASKITGRSADRTGPLSFASSSGATAHRMSARARTASQTRGLVRRARRKASASAAYGTDASSGVAPAEQCLAAAPLVCRGEFRAQPRLADPGFPGDQHDASCALASLCHDDPEPRQFRGTPHQ